MSVFALKYDQTLETEECFECGMVFAMPQQFRANRLRLKDNFYCPAGHPQHYIGEREEVRLRRMLDEANRSKTELAEQVRREQARATSAETAAAKLKRRVKAGTCPCCKRTFKQLAAHMTNQHPGYAVGKS